MVKRSVTATAEFHRDSEALARAAKSVRWWPAALGFIVVSAAYALVSDSLTVGPKWAVPSVVLVALAGAYLLRWRGMLYAGRWLALSGLVAMTGAVTISVVYLVTALLQHTAVGIELLEGGALLWTSNIVTFGLWYWEVDGGGPAHRHASKCGSTDFAFPQTILSDGQRPADWMPDFLDYVFLAFNTSTAFSPTDTMVLARRAKVMMMYQSIVSLVTVAVLVARAINAI